MTRGTSAGDTAVVQKSSSCQPSSFLANLLDASGALRVRPAVAVGGAILCASALGGCESKNDETAVAPSEKRSQAEGVEARAEELKREIEELKATIAKKNASKSPDPSRGSASAAAEPAGSR